MRAIRTVLLATVAACGGSSSKDVDAMVMVMPDAPPDAPPDAFEPVFDFSCMGNAQGAAAANVMLSGIAAEIVVNGATPDIAPAHNATVEVCKATSNTCANTDLLDTKTTPMNGCPATGCTFASAALTTGGNPLDIYVKVSKGTGTSANKTTYVFPAAPVIANTSNIPGVMFTPGALAALQIIGINQDATKGMMLIAVTDCATMPITDTANFNLTLKQGGQDVQGATILDASMLDATLAGTFVVFNVPAGPDAGNPAATTEVGGTYKTKALRKHDVKVFRGGTTGTQLRPGF